jgi:hypothetical protein
MVVADEEVEHGITRAACHSLYDLVWNWGHTGVANGDGIEGLEVVDKAQGAVLFLDAEPARAVRRIRMLVDSRCELLSKDFDDLF